MIAKIYFIFTFILLQNILLISTVFSAEQYIEVDSIVAVPARYGIGDLIRCGSSRR